MEAIRIVAIVFFVLIITGLGGYIVINGESVFKNEVFLTYSDGCIENYTSGELIGAECELGRALEKEREEELKRLYSGQPVGIDFEWNNTPKLE